MRRRSAGIVVKGSHGRLGFISLIVRSIRIVVEVLVRCSLGGVAATATVTTAFQAIAALTAARQTAASASDDAPYDRENDQTSKDHDSNDGPPAQVSLSELKRGNDRNLLAEINRHAIVPTRQRRLHIIDRVSGALYCVCNSATLYVRGHARHH